MKSLIKRLDALELKAALVKSQDPEEAPPPYTLTFTGALGWIFGLAEAGLLEYRAPAPVVLPGHMPFHVTYDVLSGGYIWTYTIPPMELSAEHAATWSAALASGLWQRLKPPGTDDFDWSAPMISAHSPGFDEPDPRPARLWAIIEEACNPSPPRGALANAIEWMLRAGYPLEQTPELRARLEEAAALGIDPADPALIQPVVECLIRLYGWTYPHRRAWHPIEGLERGETLAGLVESWFPGELLLREDPIESAGRIASQGLREWREQKLPGEDHGAINDLTDERIRAWVHERRGKG